MADFWEECAACGVRFGMPSTFSNARRADGKPFYCPNGHVLTYGEGETDTLRRERDRLKQQLAHKDDQIASNRAWAESAERRATALKGVATKLKNRVAKGVCPCCNRTFSDLQRHMATKHAGLSEAEITPEGIVIQ